MNPSDLTVDQVRNELATLIAKYPERNGRVRDDYGESTCVYYTDENGVPVSAGMDSENATLVTPVCIIGQWVEEFHPTFKHEPLIEQMLRENSTLGALEEDEVPFERDVWVLLSLAQSTQDGAGTRWKDIVLDNDELLGVLDRELTEW